MSSYPLPMSMLFPGDIDRNNKAGVDVKKTCCICVLAINSDESVAKGLVIHGR